MAAAEALIDRTDQVGNKDPQRSSLSAEDWPIRLLTRSCTLRERLSQDFEPAPVDSPDVQTTARRLARWRMLAAKGSEGGFTQLLSLRGLDPTALEQRLQPVRWTARKPLPAWLSTLAQVLEAAQQIDPDDIAPDPDLPWAAFMQPFVAVFRVRFVEACAADGIALNDVVLAAAERALKRGLGMLFAAPLVADFALHERKIGRHLLTQDALRLEFLKQWMQPAHLREFLVEYSVAARGAARLIEQSQHNLIEMLVRLQHDRAEMVQLFSPMGDPGEVVALECGLSDPHRGGRAVMRLILASGLRLIYKPRSVSIDLAYGALLNWLNAQGLAHSLRTPRYLARDDHAWVEHIEHLTCADATELKRFCHNAGVLLALMYLLDATDIHDGNLIAAGTSPVIIDLETLLHPNLREPWSARAQDALRELVRLSDHSVMRSGLLPFLMAGSDGSVADTGCLGSLFDCRATHWYDRDAEASPLSPGLANTVDPMVLAAEVSSGFAETYRFLIAQRAALLAPDGPLQAFAPQRLRFVFRDTNLYIKLLAPSLTATALREGVDRSIELEALYRTLLTREDAAALIAVVDAEVAALEALDIPLLGADADDDALITHAGERIAGFYQSSSFKTLIDRVEALDEKDLALQLELIMLAFQARTAGTGASAGSAPSGPTSAESNPQSGGAPAVFDPVQVATQLLDALSARRVVGEDGSVSWPAPLPVGHEGLWSIAPLPLDFRAGNLGVALFAAASARMTGGDGGDGGARCAAGLASAATAQVVRRLNGLAGHTSAYFARNGDSLYALTRIADLLDDAELRAQIQAMVSAPAWFADLTQAAAGRDRDACELVFGFLALGRDDQALQIAQALQMQWQQASATLRTVMLRNAPRLPVCLARTGHRAGVAAVLNAGVEALCRLREGAPHDPMSRAALPAMLGCLGVIDSAGLRENVVCALASFDAEAPLLDNLEAGACGRIELLLSAADALGVPELRNRAQSLAIAMTTRAAAQGGFSFASGMPPGTVLPGFDCGMAGVGYTLLRLQAGAALPSVLLRE